ncbi:MAG: polysaccharide biosynthesis/export family protein [Planctomycetota bacterium]|nr:polysaccharide biosynthesis/export family protein [Planctomycetota bacterium]
MSQTASRRAWASLSVAVMAIAGVVGSGCQNAGLKDAVNESAMSDMPRELQMASIPCYRVAPPDILQIELVRSIRPASEGVRAGDVLFIRGTNLEPYLADDEEIQKSFKTINGEYLVQADGTVDLGPWYGSLKVEGQTPSDVEVSLSDYLKREHKSPDGREFGGYKNCIVSVSLGDLGAKQIVSGEHLIRPDGTVSLGVYGSVYVAGMSLEEVQLAIQEHLSDSVHNAEVVVDVLAYNSKKIYVITDGAGSGEQVVILPYTGGETVLDALANINGLSAVSSKQMWIARPAPNGTEVAQTMPVDWRAITQDAITTTNYQLMPGDRIYIKADGMIVMDNFVAKVTQPFNRMFGFILLGNRTVRSLQTNSLGGGGGGSGAF